MRLSADVRRSFTHVPAVDTQRARVIVVPTLTPGVQAITLGRFVLMRRGHQHNRGLLAHELVHVAQWRELGVVKFLTQYLRDYARGRRAGMRHWDAYRAISLEVDAREKSGT